MRVNAYVYAGNNPVTNIDSDGRSFINEAFDFVSDKVSGAWNYVTDEISYIGSAISGTFDKLACALHTTKSSIAGKLLIGTIGIAVAVVTTAITEGVSLGWAAATVGAEVFTSAAVGAVIGGTIYTATHSLDKYKVEDCLAEMGNGFLDGYAISGALSGAKGLFSFAKSWVKTGETTAKYTEVVSETRVVVRQLMI